MIKLLIGGSPCTYWSIAQKNSRETQAEGMGWELFKNYLIAKEKFKPDFFLYENNKSAAKPIKDQISKELGVDLMDINSALVSAQNRQRFYAFNWTVDQPEDRGIVLRDILESGDNLSPTEKSYALTTRCSGAIPDDTLRRRHTMVAEPINITEDGKSQTLKAQYQKNSVANFVGYTSTYGASGVAVPICHTVPQMVRVRKYTCDINAFQTLLRQSKADSKMTNKQIAEQLGRPQTEVEHWFRTDTYFNIPDESVWFDLKRLLNIQTTEFDDFVTVFEVREGVFEKSDRCYDVNGKMSTLTTGKTDNIIEPTHIKTLSDGEVDYMFRKEGRMEYGYIQNADNDKAKCITANISKGVPYNVMVEKADGTLKPIYEVKDGLITIKDKKYPIKLEDGYYIIRKLTVKECCRLQTMPDDYCRAVSNAQAYKGLGNGWTAEVIIHILNGALKDVPRDEEIVVLSMYDGIGTGRYCLDKMGFTNVRYYAMEIDKYAKQVAMSNYPDIIQLGDAFDVRHPDWTIGY